MWGGAVASLLVLFWISRYNYLLFHSIAELVSIAVAWGVFMLVWNARRFVGSDALVLLGTAYFFVGLVDLLHTLAYKGMGIFPAGREANLATQLWIAGRYLEGFSVLAFAGLIGKPARVNRVFLVYAAATAALLAAIFAWPVFPDCFVDGAGLTPFKKISEYLICLLLAASLTILSRKRTAIDHSVFVSMAAAIGLTIVGELAFTFYVSVYGISNLVGHFAKLASFFLVYLALIGSGLTRPYAVLFARWKQSRHDFERLVEAAPISVMGFDAQGRVTYVNPFHLRTFAAGKHGADFFIGQKIHELPGIVRAGLSEHIAKVLEGEPVFIADAYFPEFTGGHSGYQTIRAVPFVENGTVTGGILVREDATVLKRHEQRFRRALSTTSDGFWIVGPDGAIQECNQAAAAMTGYCVDELTGMHVTDIDALETPEETRRHLAALHQGHEERFETRHRRKDGSLVDVEVSVSRIPESGGQFVAFVRDITALKLSRNQLVASEEKFSRAFYSSPMLMSISSVEEGTYLEVNDAFVRATGYTRDGSIGKTSTQLGFIDAASRRTLKATLMKKRRVENLELDLVRKDGTPMVCRYWGELIRVGDQTRLLSIALDVTLEKQAEWERQAAIDLLQVLNHQSSLNELAKEVTGLMHRFSGCEAVGLRLKDGDDYPYFETSGFPLAFVQAESRLCAADGQGGVLRDSAGNPVLECMCGNVLQGRTDPRQPFFTEFGSFWSNGTSQLLASTSEAERQARTRNRCNGEGYESVALIPMRYGSETLGLLQLNDRRQNRFTLDTIQLFERLSANLAMAIKVRQDVQTLRESERRYRNLFENAPVGILESLSDGHVTDANPEMASIIGCASPDEVLQRYHNIGEKLYARPEQRAKLLEELKADGEIKGFEFEVVSADGKTLWIRIGGKSCRKSKMRLVNL